MWLVAYVTLRLVRHAAREARVDPLVGLLFIASVWTLPVFSRWILIRVYGGRTSVPSTQEKVIRAIDVLAIAWTGFVVGTYVTGKNLSSW